MPNTLEENVNRVKAAKTAIANAITAKGGTVSSGDGLEDFASDIGTIPSGGSGKNLIYDINCKPLTTSISTIGFFVKTWNGLTSFSGNQVWTDGDNIYYSSGSEQYILDKSTSRWYIKSWIEDAKKSFDAAFIWTDGNNIYLSNGNNQHVYQTRKQSELALLPMLKTKLINQ